MEGSPVAWQYLLDRRCDRQWKDFLGAMSAEFAAQLSVADLRLLLRKIGERFARQTALPACATLDDIRDAANRIWSEIDWGHVEMREADGYLSLVHHCAPLKAAFGDDALAWSPAYLEGVYQQWFVSCGAGSDLRVAQASDADGAGTIEYRLSQ